MTTTYHTPIVTGATNAPATVNNPLGQLDAAIVALNASLTGVYTAINKDVGEADTTWAVDSTTGFLANAYIIYVLPSGILEVNTIASISDGTTLVVDNAPAETIADNTVISQIPAGFAGSALLGWVNVKDPAYGARGDGVTDDTAAVQAALNALTNGGTLYFPPVPGSFYRLDTVAAGTALTVGYDNIRIMGAGPESEIRVTQANNGIFEISAGISGCEIAFLKLVNTGALATLGRALIRTAGTAGNENQRCNFHHIWFAAASTSGVVGQFLEDSAISNNVFNNDDGAYGEHGVYLTSQSKRVVLSNNVLYNSVNTGSAGFQINNTDGEIVIEGNQIRGWDIGIDVVTGDNTITPHDMAITGNSIRDADFGIRFFVESGTARARNISVTGNAIFSCDTNGIQCDRLDDSVIANNIIAENGASGVRLTGLTRCILADNHFRDNDYDVTQSTGDLSSHIRLNTNCGYNMIRGNVCYDSAGKTLYSLSIGINAGNTGNVIAGNILPTMASGAVDVDPAQLVTQAWHGNKIAGMTYAFRVGGIAPNAKNVGGLTVDQQAFDDEGISLKSSDVAHGMTALSETDTYASLGKRSGAGGGLLLAAQTDGGEAASERNAIYLQGVLGQAADTTHTAAGLCVVNIYAGIKNGTTVQDVGADGNLFGVGNRGSIKFLIDAEGDLFADGGTSSTNMVTQYDEHDDPLLVRALMLATAGKGLVQDEWDRFVRYNEDSLVDLGLLGARVDEGGLTNYTGMVRLHSGAIWQMYKRLEQIAGELVEKQNRLSRIENRLTALFSDNGA